MLVNLAKPGLHPSEICKVLSEDGTCIITGATDNLNYYPVDGDTQNPLPSNVVCLSNNIAKDLGPSFGYQEKLWDFKIYFDSPEVFIGYNQQCLEALALDRELMVPATKPDNLILLFDTLIMKHIKGILKLEANINGYVVTHDRFQYQAHQIRLGMKEMRHRPSLII